MHGTEDTLGVNFFILSPNVRIPSNPLNLNVGEETDGFVSLCVVILHNTLPTVRIKRS